MLPKGLLKEYSQFFSVLIRLFDMAAFIVAGIAAYYLKFNSITITTLYQNALLIAAGLTLIVFPLFHIYESVRIQSYWRYINRIVQAITVVLMLLACLAFLTKTGENYSRAWFGLWAGFTFLFFLLFRGGLLVTLHVMRAYGWNERHVIIIGSIELSRQLIENMQQSLWTGYRVVTILTDENNKNQTMPVQSMPQDLNAFIAKTKVDEVWLAFPLQAEEQIKKILYALRHNTITVRLVLDVFGLEFYKESITMLAGYPTFSLNTSPMVGFNRLIKAIEDRVLAALILLFISPLMLVIALGVKCTSKGPVFFKQQRHGWDGKIIEVYKFRSMIVHHENKGTLTQATKNDNRVTAFGRFLRKTSLDELPQFINVLQGSMSVVGPRPHAVEHNEFYKDSVKAYMQRHKVKPGITGWAQVNGWRGETHSLETMQKRVEYDLYYIENWSFWFDIKIIFLTLTQGFVNKNAY